MSWRLETLEGADALDTLVALETEWRALAAADPKSTWFQEPPFVLTWYRAYAGVVEPLVAVGRADDRLVGLMALARLADGTPVHAGHHHAWYHGWVADPGLDEEFAAAATDAVLRRTGARRWRWSYLPPGSPCGWVETLSGGSAVLTEHDSAVWDLRDEDAIERHLSRGLKNYVNRYRRQGDLRLERLHDQESIARALRTLAPWCDLRHGAVHADLPFRDDPRKLPFHEALGVADPSVQTSVLLLDNRPLAVHLGAFDGTRLHLGLHGYDPTEGRQSPGTILLLDLARRVQEDGGIEIDMTPGGESWKERYASRHRRVARVEVYAHGAGRTLRSVRDSFTSMAKGALARAGLEPDDVRDAARRLRPVPDAPTPEAPVFEIRAELLGSTAPRDEADGFDGVDAPWLERILEYDADHPREATTRFLSLALRLLDKGWRPLCGTDAGGTSTIAWLQPPGTRALLVGDAAREPARVFRGPIPEDATGTPVPEDAALLLLAHDGLFRDGGGGAHLVSLLFEAARLSGRSRIWVLAMDARPETRQWLLEHGRAAVRESAA